MHTALELPAVTRECLTKRNGELAGFRYTQDGEIHTKSANREYTHASAYVVTAPSYGVEVGQVLVFLHGRVDLAQRGHAQANGIDAYRRIPGIITIIEVTA